MIHWRNIIGLHGILGDRYECDAAGKRCQGLDTLVITKPIQRINNQSLLVFTERRFYDPCMLYLDLKHFW